MEKWQELEFEFARKLRICDPTEREALYTEAYKRVSALRMKNFQSNDPKERTSGTSQELVEVFSHMCDVHDRVLEIGCGRGYTCLKLAPFVKSIVGTDVADPVLNEAKSLLRSNGVRNATITKVSACRLSDFFEPCTFDKAISVDVVEHLHPDDAEIHYAQVIELLKPKGQYIICLPNRLNGPHDCTRTVYPEEKRALGFHLNETTYTDLSKALRKVGYSKLQGFITKTYPDGAKPLVFSVWRFIVMETVYSVFSRIPRVERRFRSLLPIRLIAGKKPR